MVFGHLVTGQGQIQKFMDRGDVDLSGTGQAVIAINALAAKILEGKARDNRVIPLGRG
jgi:hypothetical protein